MNKGFVWLSDRAGDAGPAVFNFMRTLSEQTLVKERLLDEYGLVTITRYPKNGYIPDTVIINGPQDELNFSRFLLEWS